MRNRAFFLPLFLCLVAGAAAPGTALRAQAQSPAQAPLVFSAFLGAASTNLAGGPSKGGQPHFGPLGVAVERRLGPVLALRAEAFQQTVGADLGRVQRDFFDYDGRIDRGEVGVAAVMRAYSSPEAARGFVAGLGAAVSGQTSCDVDLEGGSGFFGGETLDCADYDQMQLRPSSVTTSLVATGGIVRSRFALELRYNHGLQAAIRTSSGSMHVRSLAAVLHYRIGGRD